MCLYKLKWSPKGRKYTSFIGQWAALAKNESGTAQKRGRCTCVIRELGIRIIWAFSLNSSVLHPRTPLIKKHWRTLARRVTQTDLLTREPWAHSWPHLGRMTMSHYSVFQHHASTSARSLAVSDSAQLCAWAARPCCAEETEAATGRLCRVAPSDARLGREECGPHNGIPPGSNQSFRFPRRNGHDESISSI